MAERWVHPPVVAREAVPAWVGVWRFRVVALLLLLVLVLGTAVLFLHVSGLTSEDPGLGGALSPARSLLR